MSSTSLSELQGQGLTRLISQLAAECHLTGIAVCDIGGNVLVHETTSMTASLRTAAALAAGAFSAARELAALMDETGFRSIMHKGKKSSILIQALGEEYLVLVFLGPDSVEGMVRLILKKMQFQLNAILYSTEARMMADMDTPLSLEIEEKKP